MRMVPLALSMLVASASALVAQPPAPDAPVARHVAYLLEQARGEFAGLRAAPAPMIRLSTSALASPYAMRFNGADAWSGLRVNTDWNVLHETVIPIAGTRATADSALTRMAEEVAAVIPAGWRRVVSQSTDPRTVAWVECGFAGREVSLQTSLPSQSPGITLIVYKFDRPCEAGPPARPGG